VRATSLVYLNAWQMNHRPPRSIVYHCKGRSERPRYIPNPASTWAAMLDPTHDRERHWTACGLVTYDSYSQRKSLIASVRYDNAVLIGRPCKRCFP